MMVDQTEIPEILQDGVEAEPWQDQFRLFQVVDEDDLILARSPEASWFQILRKWDWRQYRDVAAKYYGGLHQFNVDAVQKRQEGLESGVEGATETKDEARQRLLFERPTVKGNETPILFEPTFKKSRPDIDPNQVAPGKAPIRMAGREPKCFFGLFKAFLGVTLMGRPAEPDTVYQELSNNPSFARACGFTPVLVDREYRQTDVPSVRKLQQFDQIMTEYGLWTELKWQEIQTNIESGIIMPEKEIVHDTSHWEAFSIFEVVGYEDESGKPQKKSQSKTTKHCGCVDKQACQHPWILNDDGAGTVVKPSGKHWAHKASILALPRQGILLDAVALVDSASHDSRTLIPHLERLFGRLPQIKNWFTHVLDDSAASDHLLISTVRSQFELTLRASINPRRRRPVVDDLPRGMAKLTPYGELICLEQHTMDYRGVRWDTERFIYGPPLDSDCQSLCMQCPRKSTCCPNAELGRQATIPFTMLSHIRPDDPPMAKRFKAMMTLRPAVERVIKIIKYDLASKDLSKRGNIAFQARLDKSFIALHILLRS